MKDQKDETGAGQASSQETIKKLGVVCLICIGLISGLVYLIQFFTQ